MHKLEFEGHLYQDVNTNRKPVYLLRNGTQRTETLERLLVDAKVIPTVAKYDRLYTTPADFTEMKPQSSFGEVGKPFIRENLKKVKVTITIEEI